MLFRSAHDGDNANEPGVAALPNYTDVQWRPSQQRVDPETPSNKDSIQKGGTRLRSVCTSGGSVLFQQADEIKV